jgi:ATP-dependent exoDNAse (exonuclease V) beta subunit
LEKCDILQVILEKCDKAQDLVPKIIEIFHEDRKAIKLLTAHRAKGLESEKVFFIETFNKKKLLPSEYAVLEWQRYRKIICCLWFTQGQNWILYLLISMICSEYVHS